MNYFLYLIIFISSIPVWGQIIIKPISSGQKKYGEIVQAQIELSDRNLLTGLSPSLIQKSNIPKALWFMHVDPWQINGSRVLTQAKIVFGPEVDLTKVTVLKVGERLLNVEFLDWSLTSPGKQQPQPLMYEEIPWYQRAWWEKNKIFVLCVLILSGCLVFFFVRKMLRNHHKKNSATMERQRIKDMLLKADSLESISKIWLKREFFFNKFPEEEASIRDFFNTLNQYQFKPSMNSDELKKVLEAKSKLMNKLYGGNDGA